MVTRYWPAISALSFGVGAWLGQKFSIPLSGDTDRRSSCQTDAPCCCKSLLNNKIRIPLPYPTVSAATNLYGVGDSPASSSLVSSTTSRVSEMLRFGFPGSDSVRSCDDYVLSYDRRNRTAHWVFEHLTKEKLKIGTGVTRESCQFKEDEKIHRFFRATNEDYKGSGYDRGHLAPAANHRWSQGAMGETFCLSNTAPQVGKGFNRDGWSLLEKYIRFLTKYYRNVYVCTGPLFLPRKEADGKVYIKYEVIGRNHVSVPTHFFKVVVMETEQGQFELLSFVMPNQALPEPVKMKHYLVPIESIERASGLLFFEGIPRNAFKKVNQPNDESFLPIKP